MKTKIYLAILLCIAYLVPVNSNIFSQTPTAYLNVTIKSDLCKSLINNAQVQVSNSQGQLVLGPGLTGPPNYEQGQIAFQLPVGFVAGYYTILAYYPPRPNDMQSGQVTIYYPGSGTAYATICLGLPYTPKK